MKVIKPRIFGVMLTVMLILMSVSPASADSFSTPGRLTYTNAIISAAYRPDGTVLMADTYGHTYPNELWIHGTGYGKGIDTIAVRSDNTVLLGAKDGKWQIIGPSASNYGYWSNEASIRASAVRADGSFIMAGGECWQIVNANGTLGATGQTNFNIVTATARPDGSVLLAGACSWQILNKDNTVGAQGGGSSGFYINTSTLRPDGSVFIGSDGGKYIVIDAANRLLRSGNLTSGYSIRNAVARPDGSVVCSLATGRYQIVKSDFSLEPIGDCVTEEKIMYAAAASPDGTVVIAGENGYYQYYYPASYYTIGITEQTTSAALTVKWNGNNITAGKIQYSTDNVTWYDGGNITNGTASVIGLSPNTNYYFRVNINDYFISAPASKYTLADMPTGLTVASADISSIKLTWNANNNGSNTIYELYCNTTGKMVYSGTAATYTHTGLNSGLTYSYKVRAKNGNNMYTAYTSDFACYTAPSTPTTLTLQSSSRISWSNSTSNRGRGYAVLNWQPVTGATGYKIWVFDGNTYRAFDVGNTTTWDSRVWKIYPSDAALNGYGDNTQSGNMFNTIKGGQDLADTPNQLYKKTISTTNDSDNSYYFKITAYNSTSESPQSTAVSVVLSNATDNAAPQINSLTINEGAANTGSKNVVVTLTGTDPKAINYTATLSDDSSGILKIQLSNDNFISFTEFDYSETINWSLVSGDGSKTVYARAIDNAGNIGSSYTVSIYLVNDIVPPGISVECNNNIPYTESNLVDYSITANDNLSNAEQLEYRMSMDGMSWSHYNPLNKTWESGWGKYTPLSSGFNIGSQGGLKYTFIQVKDANGNIGNAITHITYSTPDTAPWASSASSEQELTLNDAGENMNGQIVSVGGVKMQVAQSNTVELQLTGLVNVKKIYSSFNGIDWGTPDVISDNLDTYKKSVTFNQQGKMALYLKFQNSSGYESVILTRRYLVDYQAPEGTVKCVGSDATSGDTMQINLRYRDNISSTLRYSINGGNYEVVPSSGLINAELEHSGLNIINVKVIDEAGNVASDTISVWKL